MMMMMNDSSTRLINQTLHFSSLSTNPTNILDLHVTHYYHSYIVNEICIKYM